MPAVTFRLFTVEYNHDGITFVQALEHIFAEQPPNRIVTIDGYEGFLLDIQNVLQIQTYVFSKLRMNDLPYATSRQGTRAPLTLTDDQGLGEDMVMGYDAQLGVASIQSSSYSFRPGRIAQYMNHFFPDLQVRFLPIISPDIVQRFQRMTILKRLSFKIASTTNLDFLQESGLSAAERNAIQSFLAAPYLNITLSVGRGGRNRSLGDRFKQIAAILSDAVLNRGEDGIEHLVVAGKEDNNSVTDTVDLLEDQISFTNNVQRQGRSIDSGHLCRIAAAAINENRQMLRQRNVT